MQQKGAALFSQAAWLPLESLRRDDVAWLDFASVGALPAGQPAAATPRKMDFPDGGYFLFGRDLGGPNEVLGLVDAGPLGYLGIAAHGHADALQVWLSVGGLPVLIDPGTYSYWADKEWRDYFRGTSAHNTVRVAGLDQSVSGGRFMWTRKAKIAADLQVKRGSTDAADFQLRARHDGYCRLPGRFSHRRDVKFAANATHSQLSVVDEVLGSSPELIELFWHVAPGWQVTCGKDCVDLQRDGLLVTLRLRGNVHGHVETVCGELDPPLAWCSSNYGQKEICTTIRWSARSDKVELVTEIAVQFSSAGLDAASAEAGS